MQEHRRCLNIDWLEVHCLEPIDEKPRDADFFRTLGFDVIQRPYGTRVYEQMFTIYFPDGEPFLEVRRVPVGSKSLTGKLVIDPNSCHLRLHNRTCYIPSAAQLLIDFIQTYHYTFRRIARIDLALDFEKFDSGDDPQRFLNRYLAGRYSKINQSNISVHGKDKWDGRFWNSCSWGSPHSQIGTKFYNKSLELREAKDKPYIRQAWASAGLVDDFIQLTKLGKDGVYYKPTIWRLEFSIRSDVRNWFRMETFLGERNKFHSIQNTLECYTSKKQQMNIFGSLAEHYFHFKLLEKNRKGEVQRKDRCTDKLLFVFSDCEQFYKIEKTATSKQNTSHLSALEARLQQYKARHADKAVRDACDTLIDTIQAEKVNLSAVAPYDETEVMLLRRLIAYRTARHSDRPVDVDRETVQRLYELEQELFKNNPDAPIF